MRKDFIGREPKQSIIEKIEKNVLEGPDYYFVNMYAGIVKKVKGKRMIIGSSFDMAIVSMVQVVYEHLESKDRSELRKQKLRRISKILNSKDNP